MKEKVALERQLSYGISEGGRPLFLELEIWVCGNLLLSLFVSTAICLSCIVANFAFIHIVITSTFRTRDFNPKKNVTRL